MPPKSTIPIDPALLSPSSRRLSLADIVVDPLPPPTRKRPRRRSTSAGYSSYASDNASGDGAYNPSDGEVEEEEEGGEEKGRDSTAKGKAKVKVASLVTEGKGGKKKRGKPGVGRGIPVGAVKEGTTLQAKRLKMAGVQQGPNGRRTTSSCNACRHRKMKCSRDPVCAGCRLRGEPCIYAGGLPITSNIPSDKATLNANHAEAKQLRRLITVLSLRYTQREHALATEAGRRPRATPTLENMDDQPRLLLEMEAEGGKQQPKERSPIEAGAAARLSLATPSVRDPPMPLPLPAVMEKLGVGSEAVAVDVVNGGSSAVKEITPVVLPTPPSTQPEGEEVSTTAQQTVSADQPSSTAISTTKPATDPSPLAPKTAAPAPLFRPRSASPPRPTQPLPRPGARRSITASRALPPLRLSIPGATSTSTSTPTPPRSALPSPAPSSARFRPPPQYPQPIRRDPAADFYPDAEELYPHLPPFDRRPYPPPHDYRSASPPFHYGRHPSPSPLYGRPLPPHPYAYSPYPPPFPPLPLHPHSHSYRRPSRPSFSSSLRRPDPTYYYPAIPSPLLSPRAAHHLAQTRQRAKEVQGDERRREERRREHERRFDEAARVVQGREKEGGREQGKGKGKGKELPPASNKGKQGGLTPAQEHQRDLARRAGNSWAVSAAILNSSNDPPPPVASTSDAHTSTANHAFAAVEPYVPLSRDEDPWLASASTTDGVGDVAPLSASSASHGLGKNWWPLSPSISSATTSLPSLSLSLDPSASAAGSSSLLSARTPSAGPLSAFTHAYAFEFGSGSGSGSGGAGRRGSINLSPLRSAATSSSSATAMEEGLLRPFSAFRRMSEDVGDFGGRGEGGEGDERFEPRLERRSSELVGGGGGEGGGGEEVDWERFEPVLEERRKKAEGNEEEENGWETDGKSLVGRRSRREVSAVGTEGGMEGGEGEGSEEGESEEDE